MTVQVPVTDRSNYLLSAQITTLAARTDSQSQQLLNQRQTELVQSLLVTGRLNAATILAGYTGSKNPRAAAIAILTTQSSGTGGAAQGAAAQLAAEQVQSVIELMDNGALTAASILSSQSYNGGSGA